MKKRLLHKKWNNEIKDLELQLKRDKDRSHKIFMSYEHYEGEFTWSDIYFIGTYEGRKRVFNCTITSSIDEFNNLVDDVVSDKLDLLYPDRYKNNDMIFEDEENSEINPKFKLKQIKFICHNEELQKEMDLKKKELTQEVANSKNIIVQSYVEALPDYQYGIGLNIVTSEKMLNKQVVLDYVKKIQSINIIGFDKIFLSDEKIILEEADHYEAEINFSRPLNP